jgi:hypothetical protein
VKNYKEAAMNISALLLSLGLVTGLAIAAPVNSQAEASEELQGEASNGYGGRQVIILQDQNGYGGYNSYGQQYGKELYGNYGGGNYNGGGYGGYDNYGPIIVHIPNSYPYYPERVPLYGSYSYPSHTPHYESSYGSYGKSH